METNRNTEIQFGWSDPQKRRATTLPMATEPRREIGQGSDPNSCYSMFRAGKTRSKELGIFSWSRLWGGFHTLFCFLLFSGAPHPCFMQKQALALPLRRSKKARSLKLVPSMGLDGLALPLSDLGVCWSTLHGGASGSINFCQPATADFFLHSTCVTD